MAYLALSPVSAAVYARLNVAAVTDLATGGVGDDIAQRTGFPFVLFAVQEREVGRLSSGLVEVDLRVHAFSQYGGLKEAQAIIAAVVQRLRNVSLTIEGYRPCGEVFYDDTVLVDDEVIDGVKVHELTAQFRIYAEEA